jgi:hypothetical protein
LCAAFQPANSFVVVVLAPFEATGFVVDDAEPRVLVSLDQVDGSDESVTSRRDYWCRDTRWITVRCGSETESEFRCDRRPCFVGCLLAKEPAEVIAESLYVGLPDGLGSWRYFCAKLLSDFRDHFIKYFEPVVQIECLPIN